MDDPSGLCERSGWPKSRNTQVQSGIRVTPELLVHWFIRIETLYMEEIRPQID